MTPRRRTAIVIAMIVLTLGLTWQTQRIIADHQRTRLAYEVQRIDSAMREDPAKPFSESTYEGAAGAMLNFARARIAFVKCELANGAGGGSCRTQ